MSLPTTATLTYSATPTNVNFSPFETAMLNVVLYTSPTADPVLFGLFGVTVASDTVAQSSVVTRTIVLTLSSTFFTLFPSAASWGGAFANLYTQTLMQALVAPVTAGVVVFA